MAIKDVIFTVDAILWQRAKVEAAKRGIPLRVLVATAIETELKKAG
jgi:hypothetical protein